jgi:hypothetical protein
MSSGLAVDNRTAHEERIIPGAAALLQLAGLCVAPHPGRVLHSDDFLARIDECAVDALPAAFTFRSR